MTRGESGQTRMFQSALYWSAGSSVTFTAAILSIKLALVVFLGSQGWLAYAIQRDVAEWRSRTRRRP